MITLKIQNCEEVVLLDDDTPKEILNMKWRISKKGYITTTQYLGKINGKYKTTAIYLHRLIAKPLFKMQVDHINGNKLDNRNQNLRICTNQQNNRNINAHKDSTSKYKGVSWDKTNKKWLVQITDNNGKNKHIGRFIDEIEAANAYDEYAKTYHKEFAKLNNTASFIHNIGRLPLALNIARLNNNTHTASITNAGDGLPPFQYGVRFCPI